MTQESMSEMMASWRKMTDQVIAAWGSQVANGAKSPEGAAAMQEMEKAYLGMRTMMGQAAKSGFEPIISAAGAVPLSEFQRLADQVHTILLRLDRIDDRLAAIRGAKPAAPVARITVVEEADTEPAPKRKKKRKQG